MISKSNIYLSHVSAIQLYQRFLLLVYKLLVIGMAWSASPSFSDCSDAVSNTHNKERLLNWTCRSCFIPWAMAAALELH